MATDALAQSKPGAFDDRQPTAAVVRALFAVLKPLASLRLTVALFLLAIFLVFAGTVAQMHDDVWIVLHEYFRAWAAKVKVQPFLDFAGIFFANPACERLFGSAENWKSDGYFYFPGGFSLGLAMGVNLVAAHLVRFKVQARGGRLLAGVALLALGTVASWLVVRTGGLDVGQLEEGATGSSQVLWWLLQGTVVAAFVGSVYWVLVHPERVGLERGLAMAAATVTGAVVVALLYFRDFVPDPSGMRILWLLTAAEVASLVLLAGCILAFRKRAGIVMLHAGVALIMSNELLVHSLHHEGSMRLAEGETSNYVEDIRTVELAVVDESRPDVEHVVAIPRDVLLEQYESGTPILHEDLPFGIRIDAYYANADVVARSKPASEPYRGAARNYEAREVSSTTGVETGGRTNLAAAMVTLLSKETSEPRGTYLLAQHFIEAEKAAESGREYRVALRFERRYLPYSVHAVDIKAEFYPGTQTARTYESLVRIVDPAAGTDREARIWMNNPLRYGDATHYQSNYDLGPDGVETTGLQVVTNVGWMVPYVGCMIVATGMLAQFVTALSRFVQRRSNIAGAGALAPARDKRGRKPDDHARAAVNSLARRLPWACAAAVAVLLGWAAVAPSASKDRYNYYEFGKLPIEYRGRQQPIDSFARSALFIVSGAESYQEEETDNSEESWQPATKWLLESTRDIEAQPTGDKEEESAQYTKAGFRLKVFRIENLELLDLLKLERRKGWRYSVDEFLDRIKQLDAQADQAREAKQRGKIDAFQKEAIELETKLSLYMLMIKSFELPREKEAFGNAVMGLEKLMRQMPPRAVPPSGPGEEWELVLPGVVQSELADRFKRPKNLAGELLGKIFDAYRDRRPGEFNRLVAEYASLLRDEPPEGVRFDKTSFEAWFNHWRPFLWSKWLYVFALLFGCAAWLGWPKTFNRSAFAIMLATLAVHTMALAARVYISGRPPITTLYTSAVFIGWGCVVLAVVLEAVYRVGIGNIVGPVAGAVTLSLADFLASEPHYEGGVPSVDTFTVLQAVLDTQFWLATHVVCITLGYASTFLAGALGVVHVLGRTVSGGMRSDDGKEVTRMTYGVLCFAIYFSFVGTVLGGLWADDSWGRFWGWDPKENGALIIVLWNALVLHARWGGMVKDRGLAVLAVAGMIVTSWSWFGVNQLDVGLHSYGKTEAFATNLGYAMLGFAALMAVGSLSRATWAKVIPGRRGEEYA